MARFPTGGGAAVADSVDSAAIIDGEVNTADIADDAVTTDKIADDAVTIDKLADNSVGVDQIVPGAISSGNITNNSILFEDIEQITQSRFLGRKTGSDGDIEAMTPAEARSELNVADGAEANPDVVGQAEAEAGTATTERIWTAQRVAQAIAALGGGGGLTESGTGTNSIQGVTSDTPARNALGEGAVDLVQLRDNASECASGARSLAIGGRNVTASANDSVAIGSYSDATQAQAFAVGYGAQALQQAAMALGYNGYGKHYRSIGLGGWDSGTLDGLEFIPLKVRTTDATKTALTIAGQTFYKITLGDDEAYHFTLKVVAQQKGSDSTPEAAIWTIEFLAYRHNGGNIAIVGGGTGIAPDSEVGSSGWVIDVTADTGNDAVLIEVTGAASHNINWTGSLMGVWANYA